MSDEKRPEEGKQIKDEELDKVSGGTHGEAMGHHVESEGHRVESEGQHSIDPAGGLKR